MADLGIIKSLTGGAGVKSVTDSLAGANTKSALQSLLSQLKLGKNSGSLIDGVVNKNTGVILPSATKSTTSNLSKLLQQQENAKLVEDAFAKQKATKAVTDVIEQTNPGITDLLKTKGYETNNVLGKSVDNSGETYGVKFENQQGDIIDVEPISGDVYKYNRADYANPTSEGEALVGNYQDKSSYIPVNQVATDAEAIKVNTPETVAKVTEMETPVVETKTTETISPEVQAAIDDAKAKLGSAGGGGKIPPETPTAAGAEEPGFEGFNVKLNNGETTDVKLGKAQRSNRQQRNARSLDNRVAKRFNANTRQYQDVVGKSKSLGNHYATVADRLEKNAVDVANIAEKAANAVSMREDIKQQALQYAEANGVTVDLSGIENTTGLTKAMKTKMAELGVDIAGLDGGGAMVTPTKAEEIYKVTRDLAWKLEDKGTTAVDIQLGKALKKESDAIRDAIDEVMDDINIDYKTPLVEGMAANGEDPTYIRKVASEQNIKFSDVRKDQADWITAEDLAGNKLQDKSTFNFAGVETGIPNIAEGISNWAGKRYNKAHSGRGYTKTGGNPGAGASGDANNINFDTTGNTSNLGKLLNIGKKALPYGIGLAAGSLLNGGGSSNNTYDSALLNSGAYSDTASTYNEDPYETTTLGGYTYEQLENGYVAAIGAGDTTAAAQIADMMDMLEAKIERTSSSTTSGGMSAALSAVQQLESLYNQIGDENLGAIQGKGTYLLNKLTGGGANTAAANYESMKNGMLGLILKKGLGESGALSDADIERAMALLPGLDTNEDAARGQFQQLYTLLQTVANNS